MAMAREREREGWHLRRRSREQGAKSAIRFRNSKPKRFDAARRMWFRAVQVSRYLPSVGFSWCGINDMMSPIPNFVVSFVLKVPGATPAITQIALRASCLFHVPSQFHSFDVHAPTSFSLPITRFIRFFGARTSPFHARAQVQVRYLSGQPDTVLHAYILA